MITQVFGLILPDEIVQSVREMERVGVPMNAIVLVPGPAQAIDWVVRGYVQRLGPQSWAPEGAYLVDARSVRWVSEIGVRA